MDWPTLVEFVKKWAPHILSSGLGAFLWSTYTGWKKRKAEQEKERTTRGTLLSTFALEAVELQERWVQYDRQSKQPHVICSNSIPYEFTTIDMVNQLVQLGMPREVLHAIYRIKELNANVYSNVTRAQGQLAHSIIAPTSDDPVMSITSLPTQTFGSAAAFIRDRWADECKAVRLIIDAAKGEGVDVESFTRAADKNEREYRAQNPAPLPAVAPTAPKV